MPNNRHRLRERLQTTLVTARFNHYFDGKDHRIVLKPGESCELSYSRPHEEGYSYDHASFFHNGDEIEYESNSGGRDCDGPIDYHTDYTCPLNQLRAYVAPIGISYPEWQKKKSWVRDVYAQQMGY